MGLGFTSGMVITEDGSNTPEGGTNFKASRRGRRRRLPLGLGGEHLEDLPA